MTKICSSNSNVGAGSIVWRYSIRGRPYLRRPSHLSKKAFFERGWRKSLLFDSITKSLRTFCHDGDALGLRMQKISAVSATCHLNSYCIMSCERCDFEI